MNKKNIIFRIFLMSFGTAFGIVGIWSNIKAFSIVSVFFWTVAIIEDIVNIIKNDRIKHI